jgi:hypothetical protein
MLKLNHISTGKRMAMGSVNGMEAEFFIKERVQMTLGMLE